MLAAGYGLATNYVSVAHPSLPNYLALTGGDTFGVTTDCTDCFQQAPNLTVDRIDPSGRTWRAYMDSMPSPVTSATPIPTCKNMTRSSITTTCAPTRRNWPKSSPLTSSRPTWLPRKPPRRSAGSTHQRSLLVITWDEDDNAPGNQVATLVIADGVPPGFRSAVAYSHYSLLRTIELAWGLAPLTANDAGATVMSDFFLGVPAVTVA